MTLPRQFKDRTSNGEINGWTDADGWIRMQKLDIRGQSWGGTEGRIERRIDPLKDIAEKGREKNVLEGNSSRVHLPPYQRESDGTREPVSRNLWNRFVPVADVVGRHPRASSNAALSF